VSFGQAPLLDPERLEELSGLFTPEDLADLLETLASEVLAELDQAAAAAQSDNRPELAGAAHKIRNSGLMVGGTQLVALATELESRARDESIQLDTERLIERLRGCWKETLAAITTRDTSPGH